MRLKAAEVVEMLRDRYSDRDRYVFMTEVPSRTGNLRGASIIDVAVLCLWPSDGYHLLAFEIKVTRKDWAAEVANEQKNLDWRSSASEFYYVAPASVANEPIPGGAGWIEVLPKSRRMSSGASSRLRLRRRAVPWGVSYDGPLVGALVRSARKAGETRSAEQDREQREG